MAFGDTEYDEVLRDAWYGFCDRLKEVGDLVFDDPSPATPLERAVGLQYVSRLIPLGLSRHVENDDPLYPHFWRRFNPTMKWGGDNPDATNISARIDGEHTYRVVGHRGSAHFIAFTANRPIDVVPPGESVEVSRLLGHEIETEWDGSFVVTASPTSQPGNWLRTVPGVDRLGIRQFFGDWEREDPMTVRIERVGAEGPPLPQTPEQIATGLANAAEEVMHTTAYWRDWQERYREQANNFIASATAHYLGAAPGGTPLHCYWIVQPDEALIIEFTPPECYYWNFEHNNYWMASIDYRYHLSSINMKQAALEPDGSVRLVIAHEDPGVPNWLGTDGHCEGHTGLRWMLTESEPVPETRLVKLADLPSLLPGDARRMTPEERVEQLRRRRNGVDHRFRV